MFDALVTEAVAQEAQSYFPLVQAVSVKNFRPIVRRLVSASLVYNKPAEGRLVDAAIAWEALFGSKERDQLSLQLALGIAWLLEPIDYKARTELFRCAKKVYGTRSKIVHGGGAPAREVEQAAEDLIGWLRRALVAMLTMYAPLMTAGDRVQRLLLQDPSITPTNTLGEGPVASE